MADERLIDYSLVGRRIREMRLRCGLTQEQLAEKANFSVSYISDMERAGKKKPSLTALIKLARVLSVGVDTLLGGIQGEYDSRSIDTLAEADYIFRDCSAYETRVLCCLLIECKKILRENASLLEYHLE